MLQAGKESQPGVCEACQVQREIPYWENPVPRKNKGKIFAQSAIVKSLAN